MAYDPLLDKVMADYGQYMAQPAQGYADGGQVPMHEANLSAWDQAQAAKKAQWEALKQKDTYQPTLAVTKEGNKWYQQTPPSQAYTDWETKYNQIAADINAGKYDKSRRLVTSDSGSMPWYNDMLKSGWTNLSSFGQGRFRPPSVETIFPTPRPESGAKKLAFDYDPTQYEWNQYGERGAKKQQLFGSSLAGMPSLGGTIDPFKIGSAIKMAKGGYVKGYAAGGNYDEQDFATALHNSVNANPLFALRETPSPSDTVDLLQRYPDVTGQVAQLPQQPIAGAPVFTPLASGQTEPAGGGYAPPPAAPALANINPELYALMQQYTTGPDYSEELRRVGQERRTAEVGFNKALESAMKGADEGPSKAELYFRLAAAFGAPTKTGHFGESLGQAAGAMGEYSKEQRTAQTAKRKLATDILLKKQELALEGVKDREKTLLALQSDNA